jgi:hypothetical protein
VKVDVVVLVVAVDVNLVDGDGLPYGILRVSSWPLGGDDDLGLAGELNARYSDSCRLFALRGPLLMLLLLLLPSVVEEMGSRS